jgi:hypothetical protein
MSVSLNELIKLYLNDVYDYDEESYGLSESILGAINQRLDENGSNHVSILKEAYNNASPEHKPVLKDFLLYIKGV